MPTRYAARATLELALDLTLWLRLTHFLNFLFLSLSPLVRSGLEILSAPPGSIATATAPLGVSGPLSRGREEWGDPRERAWYTNQIEGRDTARLQDGRLTPIYRVHRRLPGDRARRGMARGLSVLQQRGSDVKESADNIDLEESEGSAIM